MTTNCDRLKDVFEGFDRMFSSMEIVRQGGRGNEFQIIGAVSFEALDPSSNNGFDKRFG